MHTMIFLGAGASAADGAPIQGAIFREYARRLRKSHFIWIGGTQWSPEEAFPSFLQNFFGIDVHRDDLDAIDFPTFEEAFGVLELARSRGESFGNRSYQLGNYPTNWPTLDQMRFVLVEVLAHTIAATNSTSPGVHSQLCRNLDSLGFLNDITFVTTNYDTFIDDALAQLPNVSGIDYGFNTDPFAPSSHLANLPTALKIHGSLDWLYCQSCLSIEKASNRSRVNIQCAGCDDFMVPLIVPPTFFKQMGNPVLSSVWRTFQRRLHQTDHVVFCGYSFPDADLHVKYALKHREIVARRTRLKITVVNEHPGKLQQIRADEQLRYNRFFRESVHHTAMGFHDFAADPSALLN